MLFLDWIHQPQGHITLVIDNKFESAVAAHTSLNEVQNDMTFSGISHQSIHLRAYQFNPSNEMQN